MTDDLAPIQIRVEPTFSGFAANLTDLLTAVLAQREVCSKAFNAAEPESPEYYTAGGMDVAYYQIYNSLLALLKQSVGQTQVFLMDAFGITPDVPDTVPDDF